jgi:hypothetical protein
MRCADLDGTWAVLRDWFDQAGVLVLPPLRGVRAGVSLDADLPDGHPATGAEQASVLDRMRALITHFDVRAVYVGRTDASVTLRAVAGGVVHELTLTSMADPVWQDLSHDLDGAHLGAFPG